MNSETAAHSFIPHGIEFTDLGFLKFINRMEASLAQIKDTDEQCYND